MGLYLFGVPRASPVTVDGVTHAETEEETGVVGTSFRFNEGASTMLEPVAIVKRAGSLGTGDPRRATSGTACRRASGGHVHSLVRRSSCHDLVYWVHMSRTTRMLVLPDVTPLQLDSPV